ncbi:MAG: WYL domain-containing protein [Defluviitaleaceae bacterium]|nr:WYL domain-containing protein [Defluviitaleaceae bacterium]
MPYNELVKDISRIRDYMREFFVYGFKNREEIKINSPRSYDNERRRIESWLGDYMSFRQDTNGKNVFISLNSRQITKNPLYQMWKAKSFTKNDITIHFWLLDMLSTDKSYSLTDIMESFDTHYISAFQNADPIDESTLRKKLREYTSLGLVCAEKQGKQLMYKLSHNPIDIDSWREAITFFAEADPMGIIGSYLLEKLQANDGCFSFKHNYLLFAPDSGIMLDLLTAINEKRSVDINIHPNKRNTIVPLKIYISTQAGRQYLVGCSTRNMRIMFFRLDTVISVKQLDVLPDYSTYQNMLEDYSQHLWGVATGQHGQLEEITVQIKIEKDEHHIVKRLEREKRRGTVEQLSPTLWRFTASVYDAQEMLPWLRTFTGRIVSLSCSNKLVEERFNSDINAMAKLYGGGGDVI